MIQDVDGILQNLLLGELKRAGSVIQNSDQLRFQAVSDLDAGNASKPTLNLFLHDIRENLSFRDSTYHVARPDSGASVAKRRGPVTLDLSYVATVQAGGDPNLEHRILSDVLSVLLRNTVVPQGYMAPIAGEESASPVLIAVAQPDHPAHNDSAKLWQALGSSMRPTLGIVVTAAFNPFESKEVRVVLELVSALRKGADPNQGGPADVRRIQVGIAGMVSKEGDPLGGAEVQVPGLQLTSTTDDRGLFYFTNVPPGRHKVKVRYLGYATQEIETIAPPIARANEIEPLIIHMQRIGEEESRTEDSTLLASVAAALPLVEIERTKVISITGRLRHADGTPAAFIPVRCESQVSATDVNGVYDFQNVKSADSPVIAEVSGQGDVPAMRSAGGGRVLAVLGDGNHPVGAGENGKGAASKKPEKSKA